jgi:hypothetical protein
MNAGEIAAALGKPQREGRGWKCLCPLHEDTHPSLSVVDRDGRILAICRAGCDQIAVVAELKRRGLWPKPNGHDPSDKPRIVATYAYVDEGGRLLFEVCRLQPKGFRQRRPDGAGGWVWTTEGVRKVIYHADEIVAAAAASANGVPWRVYVVEGEKDADRLRNQWGLTATCNPGGAGKWRAGYNKFFTSADVVILGDNDEAGRKHAQEIAQNLVPVAATVRIVKLGGLPDKGDVSDWMDAGAGQNDLETLVEATAVVVFEPVSAPRFGATTTAAQLVAREFQEPRWAVPELIAEGLMLLAGKPKTGKSWLALDAAVAVAGGYAAFGNIVCPQGDTLLLALEDNARRLHQRLKAVLQGQPAPAALEIATQWRRADEGGLDDLRAWLKEHPRAGLVTVDTLQMIRGQRSKSEGIYADDYAAVGQLKGLADRSSVPFLLVHHLRKEAAGGGDPLESVSGTAAITGCADTVLILKRAPKETLGVLHVRGRDLPEAEIAMQFDPVTGKWLRLLGADDFRRGRERNAIMRVLLDLDEPMSPTEIATAIGKPRGNTASIRMLLKKMRQAGDVIKCADGRYAATRSQSP